MQKKPCGSNFAPPLPVLEADGEENCCFVGGVTRQNSILTMTGVLEFDVK